MTPKNLPDWADRPGERGRFLCDIGFHVFAPTITLGELTSYDCIHCPRQKLHSDKPLSTRAAWIVQILAILVAAAGGYAVGFLIGIATFVHTPVGLAVGGAICAGGGMLHAIRKAPL